MGRLQFGYTIGRMQRYISQRGDKEQKKGGSGAGNENRTRN
ncbi:hypothetical protein DSW25_15260 [Sulfitobacter donghicola DSW-25 = KCTC 12864 = JCM 14565]|uniref:Uncharacterized protein n=1 Tax=Sulfitobacter donghicola DSW-25 = KCTC 12864 = JCM 14565 TaxID=1300350 RepID=A0A073IFS1_9RHOB|nr:hypothetical protein DSW25_15260 [Sulfitobacter donghicola DSW-25 = KCTC 12864 = JCM 14565]